MNGIYDIFRTTADLSAAASVIVVVKLFLDHITRERQKDRELWSNHLSQVVESLNKVAMRLEILAERLKSP